MTGFSFAMIAQAITRLLVDELVDRIEECRACVEGVRLCAWHHAAALRLLPGCDEPDCWTCLPPQVCGAPLAPGIACARPPHANGHGGTVPRPEPHPSPTVHDNGDYRA